MSYTISDFYCTFSDHLQLITGQGGLSREISTCGILDYELLPELKDKYYHSNFQSGQFIVTSLLYAKDSPHIIINAVKHLISKGCSGLAIRNVLKLQIPEAVIRYADSKNFPVFLVNSVSLPFETIICTIDRQSALNRETGFYQGVISQILNQTLSAADIRKAALQLNPSFNEQFFGVYCKLDDYITDSQKQQYVLNYKASSLSSYEDFLCPLRRGLLLIRSGDRLQSSFNDDFIRRFIDLTFRGEPVLQVGISSSHNTLTEFRAALHEMLFACAYSAACSAVYNPAHSTRKAVGLQYYDDLGTYQVIFPYCRTPELRGFSSRIIDPVEEYDTENNTRLLETLTAYIQCGSSIAAAAERLCQHEQTIRYRLNKICAITGLDRKSAADWEQLSLACKIHMACRMLEEED